MASSKEDLISLNDGARAEIGHALFQAQLGGKHEKTKPFHGVGGSSVFEIVEYNIGGTYEPVRNVERKRWEEILG